MIYLEVDVKNVGYDLIDFFCFVSLVNFIYLHWRGRSVKLICSEAAPGGGL